ncbi:MAG: putative acyltransferase [Alphaproteobacteria bacterium MarineAlpha9_Bin4]|nr:acetyl-CoA acetyltransferase [Pelagibacterales bacterium]PPR26227.1 MAG: putative acyltransferase [Alphaproteobacteria bacterium MarineAlpha9_Bin4]|tara:strand:- start:1565 stop:2773 length:1209 start_codon:yes stop_codon:yes gene_type:complete
MNDAYIYDAIRTPRGIGKRSGSLHQISPIKLASKTLRKIKDRNSLKTSFLDDVVLGCVHPVFEQGSDIARIAVLDADYDQSVPGTQVDRFCASGLEACNIAAAQVISGQSDLTIGGGVESMSRVPLGSAGGAWMTDPSVAFKTYFIPQGISADLLATEYNYNRDDVDFYAVNSQKKASNAWSKEYFKNSVFDIHDQNGDLMLSHDELIRKGTTMQTLGSLKPSFENIGKDTGLDDIALMKYPKNKKINHVHHAGNSSGIVDGAAAVLIGNEEIGKKLNLKPRAKIKAFSSVGTEPTIMLTGPEYATKKVLKRANMDANDIDLFEVNEAFAAVVLRFIDAMKINEDVVNVNGGAIAMGHPLGATGAMLLGTLLDELERRELCTGLITLCVGAGMGTATIIERV